MGAEGPLVGSPVFKTDGDGAPVLVCSIRTRPRQLRTALSARGSAGAAKPPCEKRNRSIIAPSSVPV